MFLARWIVLLLASLALAACSGLAGEPEIVATLPPPPTAVALSAPQQVPDLANGAALYAQNCTDCHGGNGDGRGELVLNGEVPTMASFLDADYMRDVRLQDTFAIITNGNLQNLMPPWGGSLSANDRWDLAYYVQTLHYSAEQIALGEGIYARECVECHGETGAGDGPEMRDTGREANNFTDLDSTVVVDDAAWYVSVAEGVGEVMPAFADALSEDEMWAAVAYARLLGIQAGADDLPGTNAAAPLAENTAAPVPDTFDIVGVVRNGTRNAPLPANLPLELRYGNHAAGIQSQQMPLNADGSFRFTDVPYNPEYAYVVFTRYDRMVFPGDSLSGAEMLAVADSYDLTIYERTEDLFVLSINDIQTTISPMDPNAPIVADDGTTGEGIGPGLLFQQVFTISNSADRAFLQPVSDDLYISLPIDLPPGAVILNDPNDRRYIAVQEQFTIVDTQPIFPGDDHTLQVFYFVPYENSAVIDQNMTIPLNGDVTVRLAPTDLTLSGGGFVQAADANPNVNRYVGTFDLARNESLRFDLEGAVSAARPTSDTPQVVTSERLIPILALFGLILVGFGAALYVWSRRTADTSAEQARALTLRIAELDDMHANGQLDADSYQQERARLKQQLAALLAQQPATSPATTQASDKAEKTPDDDPQDNT